MIDFDTVDEFVRSRGQVVRLVVAEAKGSTPRDAGTDMLIWSGGLHGTIGGGRLEYHAIRRARQMIAEGRDNLIERQALGPGLHQCCGGAVTLVFERFDAEKLAAARIAVSKAGLFLRRVEPGPEAPPKPLQMSSACGRTLLSQGWLSEPIWRKTLPVYIYGAGHVGRALASMLAPLPQFEVYLSDVRQDQFGELPKNIHQSWETLPTDVLASAPDNAAHFIMTPEHDYDLELCHRLLSRSFGFAGLIGSETKWARFRSRLAKLGHAPKQISRIQCPIGDPALGKHPQEIALGVVLGLLHHVAQTAKPETSPA